MTDAPPAADHTKRPPLRRSRDHKMIAGVCGGLGRCFDLDPVVFRVSLGVLGVTGGLGLIVYGFAWLLIPLEGEEENEGRRLLSGRVEGPALTAVLCALVGCGLFLSMLNNSGVMSFALMLTIALSGAAYWSQQRHVAEEEEEPPTADKPHKPQKAQKTMEAPPETQAPPAPGTPSWWRDPLRDTATTAASATPGTTGYLWGPDYGPYDKKAAAMERARPVRASRALGGWTFLLAMAALAAGTGLTWHHHPLGTSLEIGLACALGVFGLGVTISSLYGRTGGGTVMAAVLTGALLTGAAALPKSVTTDWHRITWHPASAAEAEGHGTYELGSGVGELDLTGLPWPKSAPGQPAPEHGPQPVSAAAEVGAGQLKVVLPEDVTAELTIEVGVGDIRLPGQERDDFGVRPGRQRHVTLRPPASHPSRGTLELRLKVGIGQVEVDRAAA
ncbi:phage shock protein PspC (stress-responsive transcriptional regulator) [Streptomyces olivoverticillatus]|uniref:Phage shock protein PspC (Stress-responsive transcriptional regulator) n=1 Tax=Streptomyces olivoverticillatus TaxID=66427 RepID=A0A7W7PJ62_9ACTN|nr:PspC domain-containing protein [Streptomyces olivoverticillatus]MBB4891797.1 phage shock protein PspC (stress-responsive transcriptional regulator) [Streptomyces olivoverticillatus]